LTSEAILSWRTKAVQTAPGRHLQSLKGLRGELPSFVIDLPTLGLSHRGDSSLAVEHSAVRGRRGR
jgi:hypothetical protein